MTTSMLYVFYEKSHKNRKKKYNSNNYIFANTSNSTFMITFMVRFAGEMRLLTFLTCLLLALHAIGQGKPFKAALEETRKPGQPYHATVSISNDKETYYSKKAELKGYASQNKLVILTSEEYRVKGKILFFLDFIPEAEKGQYDAETQCLKNGGLLNYIPYLASIPKDAQTLAKAEKIFQKAKKDEEKNHPFQTLQSLHEAALMGHAKAKIAEASYYAQGKCGKTDKKRAQQLVDELLLTDDPQIWNESANLMSDDGKAYVSWRKKETKDVPFRYLYQYVGSDIALEELHKQALSGDAKAQKYISNLLWSGKYVPQDKREASKWAAMLCAEDIDMRDRLIIAKGEGLYTEEIPLYYYMEKNRNDRDKQMKEAAKNGNKEAEWTMLVRDNFQSKLAERAKDGDRRSAEVLNIFLNRTEFSPRVDSLKMEYMLMLYKNKGGFDKYAADVRLLKEKLNEALAFTKSREKKRYQDGGISSNFSAFYGKYPQYDKEHLAQRAYVLNNLCKVTEVLNWRDDPPFYTKRGFTMDWNDDIELMFVNGLLDAVNKAKRFSNDPVFGGYFTKTASELQGKLDNVYQLLERDRKIYADFKHDESEDDRINKMGLPQYKFISEWHSRPFDDDEECYLYFPDIDKYATVFRNNNDGKVYYTGPSITAYTNERDAIIATYVYLKYKKIRRVGIL